MRDFTQLRKGSYKLTPIDKNPWDQKNAGMFARHAHYICRENSFFVLFKMAHGFAENVCEIIWSYFGLGK